MAKKIAEVVEALRKTKEVEDDRPTLCTCNFIDPYLQHPHPSSPSAYSVLL